MTSISKMSINKPGSLITEPGRFNLQIILLVNN